MRKLKLLFIVLICMVYNPVVYGQDVNSHDPNRPNIILIVADDVGYSALGSYGGEIHTPNLDKLAYDGLRFTNFTNFSMCSPSRAALMTGCYPQIAGVPRIRHSLGTNVMTIAEALKQGGYQTGMTGKWHLSKLTGLGNRKRTLKWVGHRISPDTLFAPLETYPVNRGFDDFYGVIWGVVDKWDPFSLVHNESPIKDIPDDFLDTYFYTDKAVDLIDEYSEGEDPFFLYVAYTAAHWPLNARESDIEKYNGVYDIGWDSLRNLRYHNQIEMGLLDPKKYSLPSIHQLEGKTGMTRDHSTHTYWKTYKHKKWETKHMQIQAAMIDEIDQGVGKIVKELKRKGIFDNTIILFLSDNGASPERLGKKPGFERTLYLRDGSKTHYITEPSDGMPDGQQDTYAFLGPNWVTAANAPFRYWKAQEYRGGISTPLIVHWSGLKTQPGAITDQFGNIMDIMPTLLDITDIKYPNRYDGQSLSSLNGKSLLPIFENKKRKGYDAIYWSYARGSKAILKDGWKMSSLEGASWELFNYKKDRTEVHDLSKIYPNKVKELKKLWKKWYEKVNNPFRNY